MPHCDLELYEAVLRAIWNPESISKFLLLGNQLQEYIDKFVVSIRRVICLLSDHRYLKHLNSRPMSTLKLKVPCLLRAGEKAFRTPTATPLSLTTTTRMDQPHFWNPNHYQYQAPGQPHSTTPPSNIGGGRRKHIGPTTYLRSCHGETRMIAVETGERKHIQMPRQLTPRPIALSPVIGT